MALQTIHAEIVQVEGRPFVVHRHNVLGVLFSQFLLLFEIYHLIFLHHSLFHRFH